MIVDSHPKQTLHNQTIRYGGSPGMGQRTLTSVLNRNGSYKPAHATLATQVDR